MAIGGLAAFPGAEGFGAGASGGRGGRVLYVTTLAASGPGSLQWAIDQPGPRMILFKVSGLIDARIHLSHGDVTIAGHTSPGGITVRGFVTDESPFQDQDVRAPGRFAENWILQHLRIRPGLDGPSDDGLRLRYTRRAIVDHVSIGNATDEAVEISYSNNVTIQNSILAETVGSHAFYGGMLMNYSNPGQGFALDNLSIHHNLFTRIQGRLPEASRESAAAAGSTMNLEITSNLYWDPRFFIALGANTGVVTDATGNPYPIHYRLNAINNHFRTGSTFPYGMFDDQILREPSASANQLFISGNRMSGAPGWSDFQLFYCCNDFRSLTSPDAGPRLAQALTLRHPFPAITSTAALDLPVVLPRRVGAWPRDPMDSRLLQPVLENRIDPTPSDRNPDGDGLRPAFDGAPPPPPVDTDLDGMPDGWELARGLDPLVYGAAATTLSPLGYTDLEVYLHDLAARLTAPVDDSGTVLAVTPLSADRGEGRSGRRSFRFLVERLGNTDIASVCGWAVQGSGARPAAASDFRGGLLPGGTLFFAPGVTSQEISVAVAGDTANEGDETFQLQLSTPSGARLDPRLGGATGTIHNDDRIGSSGADLLVGTALVEFFNGAAGADTITSGGGADVIGLRFGQSGLGAPDRITDFNLGRDRIDLFSANRGAALAAPAGLSRAADNSTASSLEALTIAVFADANGAAAGNQPLGANRAALVVARHSAIAGTYLLVNDSSAARSSSTDLMVMLGGAAPLPPPGPITPVGLLFV